MPRRWHNIKKPKIRQDWSKENLYNLSRAFTPSASNKTFFQQKWLAKSMTRAYHNPHVREGTWTRLFDRRLPAVVPMDFRYLARHDGSELARGRGGGLVQEDPEDDSKKRGRQRTPYMHMAYYPMERRLDTAIWRALFASSTRQARQFVTRGFVKVNGKPMIYPGYLLNPGDMFSVEPDCVLYATGARKIRKNSNISLQHKLERKLELKSAKSQGRKESKVVQREAKEEQEEEEDGVGKVDSSESSEANSSSTEIREEQSATEELPDKLEDQRQALMSLIERAKMITNEGKTKLSAKRQQELRLFARSARNILAKARGGNKEKEKFVSPVEESVDGLTATFTEILSKIPEDDLPKDPSTDKEGQTSNPQARTDDKYTARKQAELLHAALARAQENPVDTRKPYATPWRPREYMSAFAFIPRYLEVNQNICSAVYLRHPVARPGLAEVPTPFSQETSALAFNWYLRRR